MHSELEPAEHLEPICPRCSYDLRGIDSDCCPECGLRIDRLAPAAGIPWDHRRQIGRAVAFTRTVWLAAFRPSLLIRAAAFGSVDPASAARFRNIVCTAAGLFLAAGVLLAAHAAGGPGALSLVGDQPFASDPLGSTRGVFARLGWEAAFLWSAGVTRGWTLLLVLPAALMLAGTTLWSWPMAAAISPQRRDRARAVANYGTAALLGWCLPAAVLALPLVYRGIWGVTGGNDLPDYLGAAFLLLVFAVWAWANGVRLVGGIAGGGLARHLAVGSVVPVFWLASVAVVIAAAPALIGLLWIMLDSLRA